MQVVSQSESESALDVCCCERTLSRDEPRQRLSVLTLRRCEVYNYGVDGNDKKG